MQKKKRLIRFNIIISLLALTPIGIFTFVDNTSFLNINQHVGWLLYWLPFLFYPLLAYLGYKLNQTRIFFISYIYFGSYILTILFHNGYIIWLENSLVSTVTIALPISLSIILLFKESKLFGVKGFFHFLLCTLPFIFMLIFSYHFPVLMKKSLFYTSSLMDQLWASPIITIPIVLFTIAIILNDKTLHFFMYALLVSLLPFEFAMNRIVNSQLNADANGTLALCFSAIAILFSYAIYYLYWEKAYIDELTGIPNRRSLNESLQKLGKHYSLAMIDIDYFKKLNDTYGHAEGDNILRYLATYLNKMFGDDAYRYGGEEFCIIFDGLSLNRAVKRVDWFRQLITSKKFFLRIPDNIRKHKSKKDRGNSDKNYPFINITFSSGLACRDISNEQPIDIINQADKAMYWVKSHGRNRVISYEESE